MVFSFQQSTISKKQVIISCRPAFLNFFSKNIYQSGAYLSIKGGDAWKNAKNNQEKGRKVSILGKVFPLFPTSKGDKN